jgi:hypothetical protein
MLRSAADALAHKLELRSMSIRRGPFSRQWIAHVAANFDRPRMKQIGQR